MNEMTLDIVSRCLRMSLYSHIDLIFMLYLTSRACGKPRRRPMVWAIMEARILLNIWILEILGGICGQEEWYPLLVAVNSLIHNAVSIPMMLCFPVHLGKSLLAALWTETFTMGCQMGAWTLAYWGTGKMYIMIGQPLYPRDALMVIFYLPICGLCALALTPALRFYRRYEFRYPRLLLGISLLLVFGRVCMNIYTAMPRGTYWLTFDLVLCELSVFLLAFFLTRKARLKRQVYTQQQQSVEAHLSLLREQAALMAKNRELMEERLSLMESLPSEEQSALAGQYLLELKEQYSAFLSQVRCRDPLVDALLSYRQTLCAEKGIATEFFLENYGRGGLEEQEMAALLLRLLDWATESCLRSKTRKEIALSISLVKGQMLVEVNCGGKKKLTKESLGPLLARHDGAVTWERTEDGQRVRVLLEAR